MKIISHRGNLNGVDKTLENNPQHILKVLKKFEVEIDVWYIDEKWFLGHDNPQYEVLFDFFKENMWIHCKNLQACEQLSKTNLNWFWHENDKVTLTSKGYIWSYPDIYVNNGITVEFGYNKDLPKYILGICTDYPELYNE
jgi:hypothetical protein